MSKKQSPHVREDKSPDDVSPPKERFVRDEVSFLEEDAEPQSLESIEAEIAGMDAARLASKEASILHSLSAGEGSQLVLTHLLSEINRRRAQL